MTKFNSVKEVSEGVINLAEHLRNHLVNLTKKPVSLTIIKEKGIVSDLKLETYPFENKEGK